MPISAPRKIVFVTIALDRMAGGLERNIIRIANYLASRGCEVSILSFDLPGAKAFYPMDGQVQWHKAGRTTPHGCIGFFERLKLLRRMRKVLPRGATVIAFHHGLLVRLMLAGAVMRPEKLCRAYRHIFENRREVSTMGR